VTAGLVYIVQGNDAGPCKIGFTTNPERRLKTLRNATFSDLRVVRLLDGDRTTERWLHQRFSHQRINGEWFAYDEDMLTVVPPVDAVDPPLQSSIAAGESYNDIICNFIDAKYGGLRNAERLISQDAKSTPKSARNWLQRSCAPNGENLLNLMAANPGLTELLLMAVEKRRYARGE
jgi:Meiotically up-regulated gene 113